MKLRKKYLLAPVVCSASMLFFGGNIAMAGNGHRSPKVPLPIATQPSALWGRNSSVSPEELNWIYEIEHKRHYLKSHPKLYEELCSKLQKNIRGPHSINFRMYCLSIAVKIMEDDKLRDLIHSLQETDLDPYLRDFTPRSGSSGYVHLFYRCIDKCRSSDVVVNNFAVSIVRQGIDFLKRDGLSTENFGNYDSISKLYILKSICALASNNITTEDDKALLLDKIGKIKHLLVVPCDAEINCKILLTYAKIPGDMNKQLEALDAIFGYISRERDFTVVAGTKEGLDALLAYANIPVRGGEGNRLRALDAIFGRILGQRGFRVRVASAADEEELRGKFDAIATKEGGIDALLAYARIPVKGSQGGRIAALEAVHFRDPRRNAAVKKLAGNIYTFVRAKSNYENKSSHLKRLDALVKSAQRPAHEMRAPAPGVRRPAHEMRESESETQEPARKRPARGTHRDLRK